MSTLQPLEKQDPIKELPLRDPGESLREQIREEVFGPWMEWALMALLLSLTAFFSWIQWISNTQVHPIWFTGATVVCGAIATWRWKHTKSALASYRLGLKGERHVGQFLQSHLIPRGYHVLHDICFDDFNIDHVAIGPGGVFAIEVKTYSKSGRKNWIDYDGERVLVNGRSLDRDPIRQASANAQSLQEILRKYTGYQPAVQPVVIFPQWWVQGSSSRKRVWVLPEKALLGFIDRESEELDAEKIGLLYEGLARYVRERLAKDG